MSVMSLTELSESFTIASFNSDLKLLNESSRYFSKRILKVCSFPISPEAEIRFF